MDRLLCVSWSSRDILTPVRKYLHLEVVDGAAISVKAAKGGYVCIVYKYISYGQNRELSKGIYLGAT